MAVSSSLHLHLLLHLGLQIVADVHLLLLLLLLLLGLDLALPHGDALGVGLEARPLVVLPQELVNAELCPASLPGLLGTSGLQQFV